MSVSCSSVFQGIQNCDGRKYHHIYRAKTLFTQTENKKSSIASHAENERVNVVCRNMVVGLISFQLICIITSWSLSSRSCTSFFTKSATNSTQANISMIGKTKEMASRYLGNTGVQTVTQIYRKHSINVK